MKLHLEITGVILLFLSVIHTRFPWYFKWKTEFREISLINRQMMYIHTLFIGIAIMLIGVLCLFQPDELINTRLGKNICIGLGVFWGFRLIVQLFVYSPILWKGKRFETTVHILFTILWSYFTAVFLVVGLK